MPANCQLTRKNPPLRAIKGQRSIKEHPGGDNPITVRGQGHRHVRASRLAIIHRYIAGLKRVRGGVHGAVYLDNIR